MAREPAVTITERGAGKAARDVDRLGQRARDIRPATSTIRTQFRTAEERLFDTGGHGQWPKLAEATRQLKAKRGSDPRILRATGALYRALTSAKAAGQLDVRHPTELRFGTTIPYATFHDLGKGVPQRKPIDLTSHDRDRITKAIEEYVAKGETGGRFA